MVRSSRERNGRSMAKKLSNEIIAASKGEGGAFKKKEDTHRMAEANKLSLTIRYKSNLSPQSIL
jgi:small subunit ribosomal protein S7